MRIGRLVLLASAVMFGCAHPRAVEPVPADVAWLHTLDSAQRLAAKTQYASADSMLAMFARNEPGSLGAHEAIFWRGVFLLDPANKGGSRHEAFSAFEGYLSSTDPLPHRTEATVLRHLSRVLDSLSQSRSMDSVPAMHLVVSDDSLKSNARDQEVSGMLKTLQDSLNKTTAELERIKKRLTTTTPGKP
ncbi:MAG: hypothetical protein H0U66_12765 [Gemmatimonadaceae bacterium]|nr:hypothetical protein [Gemmatimonadaceae bacterium]